MIVTRESGAETRADNNRKRRELIPLNTFSLTPITAENLITKQITSLLICPSRICDIIQSRGALGLDERGIYLIPGQFIPYISVV